jgi:hypothetical protein
MKPYFVSSEFSPYLVHAMLVKLIEVFTWARISTNFFIYFLFITYLLVEALHIIFINSNIRLIA